MANTSKVLKENKIAQAQDKIKQISQKETNASDLGLYRLIDIYSQCITYEQNLWIKYPLNNLYNAGDSISCH